MHEGSEGGGRANEGFEEGFGELIESVLRGGKRGREGLEWGEIRDLEGNGVPSECGRGEYKSLLGCECNNYFLFLVDPYILYSNFPCFPSFLVALSHHPLLLIPLPFSLPLFPLIPNQPLHHTHLHPLLLPLHIIHLQEPLRIHCNNIRRIYFEHVQIANTQREGLRGEE